MFTSSNHSLHNLDHNSHSKTYVTCIIPLALKLFITTMVSLLLKLSMRMNYHKEPNYPTTLILTLQWPLKHQKMQGTLTHLIPKNSKV